MARINENCHLWTTLRVGKGDLQGAFPAWPPRPQDFSFLPNTMDGSQGTRISRKRSHQEIDRNIDNKKKDQAGCLFLTLSTWEADQDNPRRIPLKVANKQPNPVLSVS